MSVRVVVVARIIAFVIFLKQVVYGTIHVEVLGIRRVKFIKRSRSNERTRVDAYGSLQLPDDDVA